MEKKDHIMKKEDGYILLEKTVIAVKINNHHEGEDILDWKQYTGKWIQPNFDFIDNTTISEEHNHHACVSLTLRDTPNSNDTNNKGATFGISYVPFGGSVEEMYYCQEDPSQESNQIIQKRTDASLLTGLVLLNRQQDNVQIQSFRIMLHPRSRQSSSKTTSPNDISNSTNNAADGIYQEFQASISFTLFLPFIQWQDKTNEYKDISTEQTQQQKQKHLPFSMQLLLSIMKSNWKVYDAKMKHLPTYYSSHLHSKSNSERISKPNFFPNELSLQEIYSRIKPSFHKTSIQQHHNQNNEKISSITLSPTSNLHVTSIPMDVFHTYLLPYLRARSFDALRISCKFFHESFMSYVPGLKLFLYPHQITSLDWMRYRERHTMTELDIYSQSLHKSSSSFNDTFTNDAGCDLYKCISAGSAVVLKRRTCLLDLKEDVDSKEETEDLLHLDTESGDLLHQNPNCNRKNNNPRQDYSFGKPVAGDRKIARGGLLCDDPGLGKTITILSLILQTYGLSTEQKEEHGNIEESIMIVDQELFVAYWKYLPDFHRKQLLTIFINDIWIEDVKSLFRNSVNSEQNGFEDYYQRIENPICLRQIRKKIEKDGYKDDYELFIADMTLCFQNAIEFNPTVEPNYCKEASRLLELVRENDEEIKEKEVKNARNAKSSKNDPLSLLNQRRAHLSKLQSLQPSPSTLLIVPKTLLRHWEDQIKLHLNPSYCSKKIPIVYRHTHKRLRQEFRTFEEMHLAIERGTHFAYLFIDESTVKPFPEREILALFPIVLSSTLRMSQEWENGSYDNELGLKPTNRRPTKRYNGYEDVEIMIKKNACPLLKVHWLRLIIDEGHSMGQSGQNNAIEFASWIYAQRRWVMSGTPTPQTLGKNGLVNLLHLANFLKHEIFSKEAEGDKLWRKKLSTPWGSGQLVSFFRLKSLLSFLMVRHTKSDLIIIEKPIRKNKWLTFSTKERKAYNTLTSAVECNLVVTSMEGETSAWEDSLLNPKLSTHARRALNNILTSCCGGARITSILSDKNRRETLEILEKNYEEGKIDYGGYTNVQNFLIKASESEPSACCYCGMELQLLLVSTCGHFMCAECFDSNTKVCLFCDKEIDVDKFQEFQPGFDNQFNWITEDEKIEKEQEEMMNAEIIRSRRESITLHDPIHQELNANGVIGGARRQRKYKRGDHVCSYPSTFTDGKCIFCHEEHLECNLMNKGSNCFVCNRVAEDCPDTETKTKYLIDKLLYLHNLMNTRIDNYELSENAKKLFGDDVQMSKNRPLKAIIFSQYRLILNVVGHRLIRRFGGIGVAEYWGDYRTQELEKFKTSSNCFCMLMSKDGSHGLDLSFVTHIFFLEEIVDKSVENQVISRAYRMGATGNVTVEQLIAKESVEELIYTMNEKTTHAGLASIIPSTFDTSNRDEQEPHSKRQKTENLKGEKKAQYAKMKYLLTNLKLIRTESEKKKFEKARLKEKNQEQSTERKVMFQVPD